MVSADVLLHPIMDNRIEQETLYSTEPFEEKWDTL